MPYWAEYELDGGKADSISRRSVAAMSLCHTVAAKQLDARKFKAELFYYCFNYFYEIFDSSGCSYRLLGIGAGYREIEIGKQIEILECVSRN